MEATHLVFALLAVFFMFGVQSGESLKCYYCVSNNGKEFSKECEDPKSYDDFLPVECNTTLPIVDEPHIYCRTMVQNVVGDRRVVRGCATSGRLDRCAERTGTEDIQVEYCECEGDGCNAASSVVASILTFVVSTMLALFVAS